MGQDHQTQWDAVPAFAALWTGLTLVAKAALRLVATARLVKVRGGLACMVRAGAFVSVSSISPQRAVQTATPVM